MVLLKSKHHPGGLDEVSISSVFGRGIYRWDGKTIQDPVRSQDKDLIESEQAASTPILVNVITGERFFARWFPFESGECNRIRKMILNPPPSSVILTPVDIVMPNGGCAEACDSAVWRVYSDTPVASEQDSSARAAVLFPIDGLPNYQSCAEIIDMEESSVQLGVLAKRHNWHDRRMREMAVAIVRALESLNSSGYSYLDFHRSRIFFTTVEESISAIFDFSALACSHGDFDNIRVRHLRPRPPYYPLEFADPSYMADPSVEGSINALDYESQNYSLTAFLFYILMGFHPYDGCRLLGASDDSLMHHYAKFGMYIKLPIFVFDPIDTSNAFGALDEDQEIIDLWQDLPESIRQLFTGTLCEPRALRRVPGNNPSPQTWIEAFTDVGWV